MKSFTNYLLKLLSLIALSLSLQSISAQTTVVIPADFQSEVGCPGDWMPDCDATRLTQTSPGIWEGTFLIPAGTWQYKVTHDNSWNENYGEGGIPGGPNMWLTLSSATSVLFTYSSVTNIVTLTYQSASVTLAGDFLSELGCPSDWMPNCFLTNLTFDPPSNVWYGIFSIPQGNWQFKAIINNSWAENYGDGGVLNGANIPLNVSSDKKILFRYDPVTHITTTTPIDYSIILAGDFQSELGCPGDWMPDCPLTGLTFDPGSNLWKGNFSLSPGTWQFKVTVDGSWVENYGEGGVLNGPNFILNISASSKLSVVYDPVTHILKYEVEQMTVVLPGSFQTELGCATDWDPACDNTRLIYDETQKLWVRTFDIPAGFWEFKVAINNSWNENYGEGGIPGGSNMFLNLESPSNITFTYDPLTHIVTLVYNTTSICATAFYDANANGYKDYFENYLMEGISFELSGVGTLYTGIDGKTCFNGLTPGLFTIQETLPPGYFSTSPDSLTFYLNQPQNLYFGMVCIGGAGAENIAFWMGKKGKAAFDSLQSWQQDYILSSLRYLNLRNSDGSDFDPWTYQELSTWLQRANAKNMAYKVSAQMAVLYLNSEVRMLYSRALQTPGINFLGIDYKFMDLSLFIFYANQQLFTNSFGKDADRNLHQDLYELMVKANNDSIFVQLEPCYLNLISSEKNNRKITSEIIPQGAIRIWPNPSSGQFNLRLPGNTEKGQLQIRVLDLQGRQVYTATGSTQQDYRFGEKLTPGLYYVEVIQGNTRTNFKIIKQ